MLLARPRPYQAGRVYLSKEDTTSALLSATLERLRIKHDFRSQRTSLRLLSFSIGYPIATFLRSLIRKLRDDNFPLRIPQQIGMSQKDQSVDSHQKPVLFAERKRQNSSILIRALNATVVMLVKPEDR